MTLLLPNPPKPRPQCKIRYFSSARPADIVLVIPVIFKNHHDSAVIRGQTRVVGFNPCSTWISPSPITTSLRSMSRVLGLGLHDEAVFVKLLPLFFRPDPFFPLRNVFLRPPFTGQVPFTFSHVRPLIGRSSCPSTGLTPPAGRNTHSHG